MRILLLRHGIAEETGPATDWRDEPRALTAEGRARMERAAQGIVRLDLGVDGIVSSPLTRCLQTAAIVGDALGLEVDEDSRLRPGAELRGLAELVAERSGPSRLLLCGHQPDMSGLVGELTGGLVEFRKGSLAVIEADVLRPRAGVLRGLYPPAALRALGGG